MDRLTEEQRLEIVRIYTTPNPDGTWTGVTTIARQFGKSPNAIQYILKSRGVVTRDSKQAHSGGKACRPVKNFPPVGENPPLCACGCNNPVEWYRAKNRWRVYIDGHNCQRPDETRLRKWYIEGNMTCQEIADILGISVYIIRNAIRYYGIPSRPSHQRVGAKMGSQNHSWKGGITPERQALYKTPLWRDTIKAVFKRDNYTCQRCGYYRVDKKKLHAHHIKSFALYPDLRFELTNLITLCETCHLWVHSLENTTKEFLG